jgi:general nucleoside transport system permease protein
VTVGAEAPQTPYVATRLVTARTVGIAGIIAGAVAFWLALPPLTVRTVAAPIVVGSLAAVLGVGAITRGEKRVGWGAVVAGLVGMVGGVAAAQASSTHLEDVITWSTIVSLALVWTTPLTFAAIGGLVSERSGVVNIGLEGMMLMGAFFGIWGADVTGSWWGGLAIGMISGGALALVHAVFAIHLRADQIVSGTAVIFIAWGLTGYLYNSHYGFEGTPGDVPSVPAFNPTWLEHVPPHALGQFLADSLSGVSLLTIMAVVLVPLSWLVIFRTPLGLRIRAVGEHPRAADTVGINVYRIRYASVVTSGMLAAIGGVYLSIGFNHNFTEKMTSGLGFIALAALIFGNWRPFGAFAACLLFGFSTAVAPQFQNVDSWAVYGTLFNALPYLLTLVAVAGVIGRTVPPAADGRPYIKQ